MTFDKNYFKKQDFSAQDLKKYKEAAGRDIQIARTSKHAEVKFHFAYMALIKIGIYYIAQKGYRVKARPGHHQKIIETLGGILDSEDVLILGDKMRRDRNLDLYDAQGRYNEKEIAQYLKFVQELYSKDR